MNQRARHLIEKQKSGLKHSAEKLRALLDNPDDFELGRDGEADIRNAIGMLQATHDELTRIQRKHQ